MRVFVTGASGHIGSAVVPELVEAGHEVVGLARSDASAATIEKLGASARRGDLGDPAGLSAAAADADAVIHLAFDHATMARDFAGAVATDLAVVRALGEGLAGTGKTFIGVGLAPSGDPARDATINANPRSAVSRYLAGLGDQGVRTVLVGVPPVTHSSRDRHGFIPMLIGIARSSGVSGYVGEGTNRWPAAQVFAAAEEGIPVRDIASAIGRHLDLPVRSVPVEHFARFPFIAMDITMPNAETRALLGWEPVRAGLIADLDEGHYFVG
jgi:nucleoside-diphosphate-sugar epimerase